MNFALIVVLAQFGCNSATSIRFLNLLVRLVLRVQEQSAIVHGETLRMDKVALVNKQVVVLAAELRLGLRDCRLSFFELEVHERIRLAALFELCAQLLLF